MLEPLSQHTAIFGVCPRNVRFFLFGLILSIVRLSILNSRRRTPRDKDVRFSDAASSRKQHRPHGRRAVGKKSKTAPATAPTIEDADDDAPAGASEPSDEAASDDDADVAVPLTSAKATAVPPRTPVHGFCCLCRYRALEEARHRLVLETLRRLIERENFPRGLMLGKNTRAWALADVKAWLAGPAFGTETG